MATNAGPVYGKQYIRYAETWEAAVKDQTGLIDVEIGELRVVAPATYAGPFVACPPSALAPFPGNICGVNQAYMPTALAQPYTARQLTVATSGLLLIEGPNVPGSPWTPPALNTGLQINSLGQVVGTGTPVLLDGTTPMVREIVNIGGREMALVSFA